MEIDYSRWNEFRAWLHFTGSAPSDAISQAELAKKIDDLYVQWFKKQQKPPHLQFEVK